MSEPITVTIRTAAKAIVLHAGQILLQAANWEGQECYFLPGGGQNPGEALADTARREVEEETGLTVQVEKLLWLREYIGANHDHADTEAGTHRIEAIFKCTPTSDPSRLGGHQADDLQTGLEWVPLDKVPTVNLLPHSLRAPIAALATGDPDTPYLGDIA
ncbi:NUDIX domain-containing protein [Kitasatospora sp. RB6PN24]|uniref:NUDIX domain-containing protein n=1 Tax=Kitasatospora humi TaxID=2893891 RepID=UPI001E2FEDD1|nr:NUDIX domain-containing protein [Kitasatospora humi]MCC9311279.1 NUDIX domain-containing protein [Kitasatospora humi]